MADVDVHPKVPHLTGRHLRTYHALFQQPVPPNLPWNELRELLEALADDFQDRGGNWVVVRNGKRVILPAPPKKTEATLHDLNRVRHFLDRSGVSATAPPATDGAHFLVVIDHEAAKVYRTELRGSVPVTITPYDPHGYGRHLHPAGDDGKRRPERKSYYEAVAHTLSGADEVLLFGSGTGGSSAMEQLLADLERFHPALARRVIGAVVVDAHHITGDQLLAKAREFYPSRPRSRSASRSRFRQVESEPEA
jgi:hypothetical protein